MTIEQDFFKSFNIPTKFYTTVNLGDLDNNYQEVSANTLQELFEQNNFWFDEYIEDIKDFHDWEEKYPPITPEIVLGLIEILNREYNILIIECMANSTKITACPAPEQDWGCDEAYYRVYVEEKDLKTAILKVCSNYNVAMSIQGEVKQLFK